MQVKGWNNGSFSTSGVGYGIRISRQDRDKFFDRGWRKVVIGLEGERELIEVRLSDSFWHSCSELRSAKIGKWMIKNGLAPWKRGDPPKLELQPIGGNKFKLKRL